MAPPVGELSSKARLRGIRGVVAPPPTGTVEVFALSVGYAAPYGQLRLAYALSGS